MNMSVIDYQGEYRKQLQRNISLVRKEMFAGDFFLFIFVKI
jgi:hypothetical protein